MGLPDPNNTMRKPDLFSRADSSPRFCSYNRSAMLFACIWLALAALACGATPPPPAAAERGPVLGRPLPPLEAPDQDGRVRSFESLKGPKGLVLVLVQSADW
jgi:hypothetical protein